jgi:hypothetical protein
MSCQLPIECINEIVEYFNDDKTSLYSCLLVNRLYCKVAVEILWKNIWSFQTNYKPHVSLSIINTLISCLPKKSKDFLKKNKTWIITSIQKPPLFNYASLCNSISVSTINRLILKFLENQQSKNLIYKKYILLQEILNMFMEQISSLKFLEYSTKNLEYIDFIHSAEAKNCLLNLSILEFHSNIYSNFIYEISQICHNIKTININFVDSISDGITDLITSQNGLKNVKLTFYDTCDDDRIRIITSSLCKFSLILNKLEIIGGDISLLFISKFINLQELILWINENDYDDYDDDYKDPFDDFDKLQYIKFSQLKVLRFLSLIPKVETLIKFLEINGKNLTEFQIGYDYEPLYLPIAKFCPNLKILSTFHMRNDKIEALKMILNNCQSLESIRFAFGCYGMIMSTLYFNNREFFEILVNYSSNNFNELAITHYESKEEFKELEEFFINWKKRIPLKPLSLIIYTWKGKETLKGKMIIEKHMKMGVIKKFQIISM